MKSNSRTRTTPENYQADFREREADSTRKRRHDDPDEAYVPSHMRTPGQPRPARTDNVHVELSGPPSFDSVVYIDWKEAPNARICDSYQTGDAITKDVLRVSASAVRKSQLDEALACMVAMRETGVSANIEFYTALISTCVECGEMDHALKVLEEMGRNGCVPNSITYNVLVRACEKTGRSEEARDLRAAMLQAGIARNAAICALRGQKDDAEIQRNTMTHLRDATWPEAKLCLEALRTIAKLEPDTGVRRAAVRTYPKESLARGAQHILDDLGDAGIPVDLSTLGQVIAACGQADLSTVAVELLNKAVELEILKPKLGYDCSTNTVDFHSEAVAVHPVSTMVPFSMAAALFKHHYWQENIGPDTKLIIGLGTGEARDAVAQCMLEIGRAPVALVNPDGTRNLGRLEWGRTAILRCLRVGQIDSALAVFDEMGQQGMLPSTAGCALIYACGKAGRFEKALEVFKRLLTSPAEPKVGIYNAMIQMCGECGWIDDAIEAFHGMLHRGVKPNAGSYFAVIAAIQRGWESPEDMIQGLIGDAIGAGVFQEALGYRAADGVVSFRTDAIAAKQAEGEPPYAMSLHLAQALFEYHRSQGHIGPATRLVIGSDADEAVKPAIMQLVQRVLASGR